MENPEITFYVTEGGSGMLDPVPMGTAIQADLAAVGIDADQPMSGFGLAANHTPHCQAAQIVRISQVRDQHLEGRIGREPGWGDFTDNGVQQRVKVIGQSVGGGSGHPVAANGVKKRKFKLVFIGVQVDE